MLVNVNYVIYTRIVFRFAQLARYYFKITVSPAITQIVPKHGDDVIIHIVDNVLVDYLSYSFCGQSLI